MEDTEEEVLEMFVTGNHAGKVLEIGCEFLKLDLVIRFNVVPAPDELRKGLFFAFLPRQHLRMPLGVVHFAQLL